MPNSEQPLAVDPERRKALVIWLAITAGALIMVVVLGFVVPAPGELGGRMGLLPLVVSAVSLILLVLAVVVPPRLRVAGTGRSSPAMIRFIVGMAMIEAVILLRVVSLLLAGQRPSAWTVALVPIVFFIYFPSGPLWNGRLSRPPPGPDAVNRMVR